MTSTQTATLPRRVKVPVLSLFSLTDFKYGSTVLHNAGNGRFDALTEKVVQCRQSIKTGNTLKILKGIDVALIFAEYSTDDLPNGTRLSRTSDGSQSNWQAIDCSQEERDRRVKAAYERLGLDRDNDNNPDLSFQTFVSEVESWWGKFVSLPIQEQKEWIKQRDWTQIKDLWLGFSGHGRKCYISVQDILNAEGEHAKDLILRFVLINFARLSTIVLIVP